MSRYFYCSARGCRVLKDFVFVLNPNSFFCVKGVEGLILVLNQNLIYFKRVVCLQLME